MAIPTNYQTAKCCESCQESSVRKHDELLNCKKFETVVSQSHICDVWEGNVE